MASEIMSRLCNEVPPMSGAGFIKCNRDALNSIPGFQKHCPVVLCTINWAARHILTMIQHLPKYLL